MSLTKDQIIEAVSAMSLMEIADLINAMESKFGVSASIPSTNSLSTNPVENVEEKIEFDIILRSIGSNKVAVIKAVRSITGLGLKEAKDLVESAPAVLKGGLSKDNAEKFKKSLEEAGAEVELK